MSPNKQSNAWVKNTADVVWQLAEIGSNSSNVMSPNEMLKIATLAVV
jgi:hypothetical protein